MDAKTYLIQQMTGVHRIVDDVLAGITDEQLTWIPPGMANPIGLTALHMLSSEDYFISVLRGKARLWEGQGWNRTFNLSEPPGYGQDWTVLRQAALTVETLLAYQVVVRVEMEYLLDSLTPESLEATFQCITEHDSAAELLALLVGHTCLHAGEMTALKGVYGVKGLAY